MEKSHNCPCLDKEKALKLLLKICEENGYDSGKIKEAIEEATIGWFSRSPAVALFIFARTKEGIKVLASERGKEAADFQGLWNVPCGYVDFDETTKESAARELFEECGVKVDPSLLKLVKVQDGITENHQNITLRYVYFADESILEQEFSKTLNEGEEVGEIKWLSLDEVNEKEWAFDHDDAIHWILDHQSNLKWI